MADAAFTIDLGAYAAYPHMHPTVRKLLAAGFVMGPVEIEEVTVNGERQWKVSATLTGKVDMPQHGAILRG